MSESKKEDKNTEKSSCLFWLIISCISVGVIVLCLHFTPKYFGIGDNLPSSLVRTGCCGGDLDTP